MERLSVPELPVYFPVCFKVVLLLLKGGEINRFYILIPIMATDQFL